MHKSCKKIESIKVWKKVLLAKDRWRFEEFVISESRKMQVMEVRQGEDTN